MVQGHIVLRGIEPVDRIFFERNGERLDDLDVKLYNVILYS